MFEPAGSYYNVGTEQMSNQLSAIVAMDDPSLQQTTSVMGLDGWMSKDVERCLKIWTVFVLNLRL